MKPIQQKTAFQPAKYHLSQLAKLARRENNVKRSWLLVNPLQGKHLPCAPSHCTDLFSTLASGVYQKFSEETLLIVGFAETATAIGAALADFSLADLDAAAGITPGDALYIPTTRESIPGTEYLYFSETHSHATEQRLAKRNLEEFLNVADRVVFAEDEVTTGNTILHAIDAITRDYPALPLKFAVASILNGMSAEHHEEFRRRNIPLIYLATLENQSFSQHIERYNCDLSLCRTAENDSSGTAARAAASAYSAAGYKNPRLGLSAAALHSSCVALTDEVLHQLKPDSLAGKRVLVLGTEEFMYPPLFLARYIQRECSCGSVAFHATTRSPILPCADPEYPISSRFRLRSVYDPQRTTYVYNLTAYDKVLILHDAPGGNGPEPGLRDLCGALASCGCSDISIFQWEME